MKEWAIERGATHFTHWFQPLTGLTAEKHDSSGPDRTAAAVYEFPADWSAASPTRRASPRAACARRSRPAATPPGTPPAPPSSSERRRHDAVHPHGVLFLDRRGARHEDPAAALDGSALQAGDAHPQLFGTDAGVTASTPRLGPSRSTS